MPIGHGPIDYVVVLACVLITIYLLYVDPKRLLLLLPLFLTVDFFIPFASQLTPGRVVPLIIGGWWFSTSREGVSEPFRSWLVAGCVIVAVSTVGALVVGDFGFRPVIRSAYYFSLLVVCVFSWRFCQENHGLQRLFHGLALAGIVHGGYSVYQVMAHRIGLPYRGIVYSAGGVGSGASGDGAFRINGLADEPKRLGLVLFSAAVALFFLSSRAYLQPRKIVLLVSGAAVFVISCMTLSLSYLAAVFLSFPLVLLLSRRSWKYGALIVIVGGICGVLFESSSGGYIETQIDLYQKREMELEQRLDAQKVYRQEFYAEEYIKANPAVIVSGVGMGRYYLVLFNTFGFGAGLGDYGVLLPLNSQLLEIVFDLGFLGIVIVYLGGLAVVVRMRELGAEGYTLAVIATFLLVQSVFVQSLPLLALVVGAGSSLLWPGGGWAYWRQAHRH